MVWVSCPRRWSRGAREERGWDSVSPAARERCGKISYRLGIRTFCRRSGRIHCSYRRRPAAWPPIGSARSYFVGSTGLLNKHLHTVSCSQDAGVIWDFILTESPPHSDSSRPLKSTNNLPELWSNIRLERPPYLLLLGLVDREVSRSDTTVGTGSNCQRLKDDFAVIAATISPDHLAP